MSDLAVEALEQTVRDIAAAEERRRRCKFFSYFPDEGPLRRALYVKHLAFFKAGATFPERLFMAANRVGKTDAAAFECACHATGVYPPWWEGRRFPGPVDIWTAGRTAMTTRDINQLALLGPKNAYGTGMLPPHLIHHVTPKSGVPDCAETAWVKHVSGKLSTIAFKSFAEGSAGFAGTKKPVIWLDEEADEGAADSMALIYMECLLRTMATSPEDTNGLVMVTFTPLQGLTQFIASWLEHAVIHDGTGNLVAAEAEVWKGTNRE